MMNLPLVSLVIPTYGPKGVGLTESCLKSLYTSGIRNIKDDQSPSRLSCEIIVVDDGSDSETLAALEQVCQAQGVMELLHLEQNTGHFARVVNLGMRKANGHVVILCNNDIEFLPNCVPILADAVMNLQIGIAGPKLIYPDQRVQFGGMVYVPSPQPRKSGYFDHNLRFEDRFHVLSSVIRNSLITGACMAIGRGVIDVIGFLDERFELSAEDVDYSMRAMEAGFRVAYVGHAEAIHKEGQTRGASLDTKTNQEWNEREKRSLAFLFDKWPFVSWEEMGP